MSPTGAAADEETATTYEDEGARLFLAKSFEGAIKQFGLAYRLDPKPRYLFNIGQAYRRLGLAAEATEYYQRYLGDEQKVDATIRSDLVTYIEQYYASQERKDRPRISNEQEPAPYLAAEELIDAEELISQYVRDYRAGNNAAAAELADQLKDVYAKRRDPILLYYLASGFDQVKKNREALESYQRYLETDPQDATLRSRTLTRIQDLTPAPPGQKYLWVSLGLGIAGLAGALTGVGLFVQSQGNFNSYLSALDEDTKRTLRDRGKPLAIGSTAAYAVGGGFLAGAAVFAIIGLKKGVRQQPTTTSKPARAELRAAAPMLLQNGIGFTFEGRF